MSLDTDKINIELLSNKYAGNNFDPVNYKTNIYIGDCIRELTEQFKNINKNLEKIANNTEKVQVTQETPTFHIGETFNFKTKEYEGFETIICKQNKDGYVDKNIILDQNRNMNKVRLNKIEIQKLYDLAIDNRYIFDIVQNYSSGIGISTKVITSSLGGEEYDITDYSCWQNLESQVKNKW